MEQLLRIGKCISNSTKVSVLLYVFDNPGCRFYDIKEHVSQTMNVKIHPEIMHTFTAAGVIYFEKRRRVKHFTVALQPSDPLYSILFDDRERVECNVDTEENVDLEEICYLWNRYRRDKMWKELRRNWTLKDVSNRTGLSPSWLLRFTHGEVNATMKDFIRLCDLIGIKPSTIFRQVDK